MKKIKNLNKFVDLNNEWRYQIVTRAKVKKPKPIRKPKT